MVVKYIGKCLLIEEETKILVVGDLHLGFEESLNIGGVMVQRKMFEEMINYMDKIFLEIGKVDSVVLLGDVKHNFGKILRQEWNDFSAFVDYIRKHAEEVVIVKGNHDTITQFLADRKQVNITDYYISGSYAFLHGDRDFPEIWDKNVKTIVVGHAHPAIKLSEGIKIEKYKCFLEGLFRGKKLIVVPSFIEYNEGSDPRDFDFKLAWEIDFSNFNVKIVSEGLEVLDFGKLKKIPK